MMSAAATFIFTADARDDAREYYTALAAEAPRRPRLCDSDEEVAFWIADDAERAADRKTEMGDF